jgi:hypothetical protein
MNSEFKSNEFVPVSEKVVKSAKRRARAKSVHNLAEMAGVAKATSPAADRTGKWVDREVLINTAEESLLRALQLERTGRLAFEILKTFGALEKVYTEPQDLRTEEEKFIDYKAKALYGLCYTAIARAEDFGCPIDTTDENSVKNHEIKLMPVGGDSRALKTKASNAFRYRAK